MEAWDEVQLESRQLALVESASPRKTQGASILMVDIHSSFCDP